MKFKTGDIVKLKDDGDTDFAIVFTKGDDKQGLLQKGFDYVVKREPENKKDGKYIRQVFEENLYSA